MPTYDYRCDGCGHSFELFQSITADPIKKCSACGEMKARRIIGTGGAIIFKGSGFYQTDYRSEEYKSRAKKECDSARPESPVKETKTNTGTEAKTEAKPEAS
ncbi:MAG: zinc ribbon domain-containing protein [Candidatus Brocadiaceae bacterium]|nr:zinc ribbon domain-containing protein [Candidatus Brocadiaceae bacterium]